MTLCPWARHFTLLALGECPCTYCKSLCVRASAKCKCLFVSTAENVWFFMFVCDVIISVCDYVLSRLWVCVCYYVLLWVCACWQWSSPASHSALRVPWWPAGWRNLGNKVDSKTDTWGVHDNMLMTSFDVRLSTQSISHRRVSTRYTADKHGSLHLNLTLYGNNIWLFQTYNIVYIYI